MSDQTIETTPYNVAYYYVEYCKQNTIKVNESKIDNCLERMKQPLNSDKLEDELKKIIIDQAIRFSKSIYKWVCFLSKKSLSKFPKSSI